MVAEELQTGRTPIDCLSHYQQSVGHLELVRNEPWTIEEGNENLEQYFIHLLIFLSTTYELDIALIEAIKIYGSKSWDKVATAVPGRTKVQCRVRYDRKIVTLYEGAWNGFVSTLLLYDISL